MSSVFIIINEWVDVANNTPSEVVGGKFFTSEGDAWLALRDIAHSYNEDIDHETTNIVFAEDSPNLKRSFQYEEYYIQELTQG